MPKVNGLTAKQDSFVFNYVIDPDCQGNGHKSALAAGYSPHTANSIAAENLSKPTIKQAIAAKRAELAEKCEIKAEQVLADLKWAIATAKSKQDLANLNRSLELLGKHLDMWTDKGQAQQQGLVVNITEAAPRPQQVPSQAAGGTNGPEDNAEPVEKGYGGRGLDEQVGKETV